MTTITEIIARLGHECGLPWAEPYTKNVVDHGTHVVTTYVPKVIPPTLAEWHAEHEREHPGEPGPVASWTSEDGRVKWSVEQHPLYRWWAIKIDIGGCCRMWSRAGSGKWASAPTGDAHPTGGCCRMWSRAGSGKWASAPTGDAHPTADWAEAVRLMQAADGGGP